MTQAITTLIEAVASKLKVPYPPDGRILCSMQRGCNLWWDEGHAPGCVGALVDPALEALAEVERKLDVTLPSVHYTDKILALEAEVSALRTRAEAAEVERDEWRAGAHADHTGHLHRCAKVNGVWSCHKGCAVARAEAAERERDGVEERRAREQQRAADAESNYRMAQGLLARAQADAAELRGALEKQGRHADDCDSWSWFNGDDPRSYVRGDPAKLFMGKCSCGLDAALARHEERGRDE